MSDENIEVTEIESPFLQRAGEKLYSYKFPTKASLVSMTDGTTVEDAVSSAQDTLGDVTAEQLAEAVADAHTHENKEDVLDLLGVDEDGTLTFDGDPVGSGSGDGESSTRPWTAYGDGVDEAPEKLRDGGIYVSDEAEAPEETAQAAVLRQKRDDDLVPVYPRTAAELVSVSVAGIESTDMAGALAALQEKVEELQSALDDVYMRKANDQFTGAYYGTVVAADDGAIDLTKGSIYTATVNGEAFEVTIGGSVGAASCFTLMLTCEEDCDVVWPDSVRWPDGEAPEVVAGTNVFTFISPDAGTTWYGSVNGTDYRAVEE